MQYKKKSIILVLILFLTSFTPVVLNALGENLPDYDVSGYIYVNGVPTDGVNITILVPGEDPVNTTSFYNPAYDVHGVYVIHFNALEGQYAAFSVEIDGNNYIPNPDGFLIDQPPRYAFYDMNLTVNTVPQNNPPDKPCSPQPNDNSENMNLDTTLSVCVTDPDDDIMDVTFYDGSDNIIGKDNNVASGNRATITWTGLNYDTSYSWYALADDKKGGTNTSDVFTFKTIKEGINHPPFKPADPTPENNSEDVNLNPELSIYVEDPDDNQLKVEFYNASDESLIDTLYTVDSKTYASTIWNDLSYNKTYFWYAVAYDSEYSKKSNIFNFKTKQKENTQPEINITFPKKGGIYFRDKLYLDGFLKTPLIFGNITLRADATDDKNIEKVEFYIISIKNPDGELLKNDTIYPYTANWDIEEKRFIHLYIIKAVAYDESGKSSSDEVLVRKFF